MQSPRLTATLLLVLVWLGAALAVLQGFLTAGLSIRIESSLAAHLTGMAAGYGAAIMLILMSRSRGWSVASAATGSRAGMPGAVRW